MPTNHLAVVANRGPEIAGPASGRSRRLAVMEVLAALVSTTFSAFAVGVRGGAAASSGGTVGLVTFGLVLVGVLVASFLAGWVASRIMAAAEMARVLEEATREVQQSSLLLAEVRRTLEETESIQTATMGLKMEAEKTLNALAQQVMPKARELDAVASKMAYPKQWYQEDFDPF